MQKSRELDKKLAELVTPLGFKRIPKTRHFIRLCGDGVFQGAFWYWEPRYQAQDLNCWIESVWREPEWLFGPYLSNRNHAVMLVPTGCSMYEYAGDEYIPVRIHTDPSEEDQLSAFREKIIPRFERWLRPEDVYLAHRGSEMATIAGHPLHKPRYWYGRDYTLALLLNEPEEAEKYLEIPLNKQLERIQWFLDRGEEPGEREYQLLKEYQDKKENLTSPEAIHAYLQQCKEKNLKNYADLMAGVRGEARFGG